MKAEIFGVMTQEQFEKYETDPLKMDSEVRSVFGIPEKKYYTVSVFPDRGVVRVSDHLHREISVKKISKSDS